MGEDFVMIVTMTHRVSQVARWQHSSRLRTTEDVEWVDEEEMVDWYPPPRGGAIQTNISHCSWGPFLAWTFINGILLI